MDADEEFFWFDPRDAPPVPEHSRPPSSASNVSSPSSGRSFVDPETPPTPPSSDGDDWFTGEDHQRSDAGFTQVTQPGLPSEFDNPWTDHRPDLGDSQNSSDTSGAEQRGGFLGVGSGLHPEAVTTRTALLEKLREQASPEEVQVALAPVMKIDLPFALREPEYKELRKLFPRVSWTYGLSYTHHDHPVAHAATMVGTRKAISMLKDGERALDLHGNPTSNELHNNYFRKRARRRGSPVVGIQTMVGYNSSADYVRASTKWGPRFSADGFERYIDGTISTVCRPGTTTFLSFHTLYYYKHDEVVDLLARHPGSRMLALVNYSPEPAGKLYGELSFHKSDGRTFQSSPNGESYEHSDIDSWFQQHSYMYNEDAGIAWTVHSLGGPMHLLEIVPAAPLHCKMGLEYKPPEHPTLVRQRGHAYAWASWGDRQVKLRISNQALAADLRQFMVFRERSVDTFNSLCVKARRLTSGDLVSGTATYSVPDGDLAHHIVYAYLVDATEEAGLLQGVKLLDASLLAHGDLLKRTADVSIRGFLSSWFFGTSDDLPDMLRPSNTFKGTGKGHKLPGIHRL